MSQIRFCPNCGSTSVEPDSSNHAEVALFGGNPNRWRCDECDYNGFMPVGEPEEDFDPDQESISFDPEENYQREDVGFGKAYLKYLLYISLPATVIYYVYRLLIQG